MPDARFGFLAHQATIVGHVAGQALTASPLSKQPVRVVSGLATLDWLAKRR